MKWFEIKEKSIGKKRLLITLFCYKFFGKWSVNLIAFFVGLATFLFAQDIKKALYSNYKVLYNYKKEKKYKPTFFNCLKTVLNYAYAQADKIEIFSGNFKKENIILDNNITDKGACFIFNHIGNIEALRALPVLKNREIMIILQKNQAGIFRNFCEKLAKNNPFKIYDVEDIDIATILELDKKISKGSILFLSGDRISFKTKRNIKKELFNKEIELPYGVFKMAEKFNCEIYFISAVKEKKKYRVILKKIKGDIIQQWLDFMAEMILSFPNQFYHFYDFFK